MLVRDTQSPHGGPETAGERSLLRFLACGSVDDGKSTLIGRLLHDAGLIPDDQLAALGRDSQKYGTSADEIDFALLLDGLEAEREQSITIDVAYRYFSTPRRSFIVIDAPGHEQYTRNMATGASHADLAIILIDARKGVVAQTRRHSAICSLMGLRSVVLAVNKMDLAGFEQAIFDAIVGDFRGFAERLAFTSILAVPIAARFGDNLVNSSARMPWYDGPTLLAHLETAGVAPDLDARPLRFVTQWINRPNADFRGICGRVASGRVAPGDAIVIAETGVASRVARVITADGDLAAATAGSAITLALADELDVARGAILSAPDQRPQVADQFAAHILWMGNDPLLPGRSYLARIGARWVPATVTLIKHKLDVSTLDHLAARTLVTNEIGVCNFSTASPIAFDAYEDNHDTGAFILVDRFSNETVAAGMIQFALRRATNIHREPLAADKAARAELKRQRPCIVWFTGLPASGKSTIARIVEGKLVGRGHHTYMLDGDNLRHGLSRDLGFTDADRVENIRRAGEVARLFVEAGLIVLCAFISPFRAERQMVRALVQDGEFLEVFVNTPLEECMRRDPKGLYAKARAGAIPNLTGFSSPYETPERPELTLTTATASCEALANHVITHLQAGGYLVNLGADSLC
jgi:bifunctional enzyme CysN/CysC